MRVNPLISSAFSGDLENDAKPRKEGKGVALLRWK